MNELSADQERAMDQIQTWMKDTSSQWITLGGLAGTGKTTIVGHLESRFPGMRIHYCALSGKATQMIRESLQKNNVDTVRTHVSDDGEIIRIDKVSTIHSMLYSPIELYICGCGHCETRRSSIGICPEPQTGPTGRPVIEIVYDNSGQTVHDDLIVVDEASMVNRWIWGDLVNLGIPIIAVGDHGQLPPIGDSFNLMEQPRILLERIHRQAEGDPILAMAYMARNTGRIQPGVYGEGVAKVPSPDNLNIDPINTMVICGLRETRNKLNTALRNIHGYTHSLPQVNDRVICLRNIRAEHVFNGMLGVIKDIGYRPGVGSLQQDETVEMSIQLDNRHVYIGPVWIPQFGQKDTTNERVGATLWDYGYAITCHKAQGSESDDVVVFEEPFGSPDTQRRWLYTAVTRAKKKLLVIGK